MLNKTTGEFQAMLDGLKQELVIGEVTLSIARKIVIAAVEEEKRVEGEIAEVSQKIEAVRRGLLLTRPLPENIVKIRENLILLKSRKRIEDEEIKMLRKDLQEVCKHPLVFHKNDQKKK